MSPASSSHTFKITFTASPLSSSFWPTTNNLPNICARERAPMVTVGSVDLSGTDRAAAGERGEGGGQVTEIEWLKGGDGQTRSSQETRRCWMEDWRERR